MSGKRPPIPSIASRTAPRTGVSRIRLQCSRPQILQAAADSVPSRNPGAPPEEVAAGGGRAQTLPEPGGPAASPHTRSDPANGSFPGTDHRAAAERLQAITLAPMESLPFVAPSVAIDPDTTHQGAVPRGPTGSSTASAGRVQPATGPSAPVTTHPRPSSTPSSWGPSPSGRIDHDQRPPGDLVRARLQRVDEGSEGLLRESLGNPSPAAPSGSCDADAPPPSCWNRSAPGGHRDLAAGAGFW